jgi:hypothetical protein
MNKCKKGDKMRLAKLRLKIAEQSIFGYFPPDKFYLIESFLMGNKIKTTPTVNIIGENGNYKLDMTIEEAVEEINAAFHQ